MKKNQLLSDGDNSFVSVTRLKYISPQIKIQLIEYEESIANGSAGPIKLGSGGNEGVFIETWDITTGWTEKQESNFDL